LCHLFDRVCHHCAACASRRAGRFGRRNPQLRYSTRYVAPAVPARTVTNVTLNRLSRVLRFRRHLLRHHDIQNRTKVRPQEPTDLSVHLLHHWIRLNHGHQSFRCGSQDDFRRQEPVHAPFDICLRHHNRCLHPHANELLQQGS
jgi:hypothetical protein